MQQGSRAVVSSSQFSDGFPLKTFWFHSETNVIFLCVIVYFVIFGNLTLDLQI